MYRLSMPLALLLLHVFANATTPPPFVINTTMLLCGAWPAYFVGEGVVGG